jgi:phosphatidylglycerophosphatase A
LPLSWPVVITAFFLFRAFDMFKIYPVNRLEEIPGGVGVMMDDIIAGLYTNLAMHLAIRLVALFH